jgi:phosphohistidine phosphatase
MGSLSHARTLESIMHLLVVRHGIAEDRRPDLDDADRELTRDGIRKTKDVVAGLKRLGWRLDVVLTSPWKRALHTAELLAPISAGAPITTGLLCEPPREELLAHISEHAVAARKRHATAVVGHEPYLGELIGWLAFGNSKLCEQIDFKKSGVAWLEGTAVPSGMRLRALLPPSVLRELA